VGNFKGLIVWKRGIEIARDVYTATRVFPRDEIYGLTSQTRRAAISISANLAEGTGRYAPLDQARFYQHAMGSARELESLLILATELELLPRAERDALCARVQEIQRMLAALIRRTRNPGS
jgi:four helix bundle protein